ncbi:MAG: 2,3,4,5-tetrahydropyridine-2,6-dicarboxylate N-succinyltransferase [Gemmatimonadota bacterium]|nr:2,3,4,5-tetrahydropyridine-2,6-dicarboxylate N-succinyltransferase [Gemmatimonadota bacterium]
MTRARVGNQEDLEELEAQILRCFEDGQAAVSDEAETAVTALMDVLTRGVVRSARRVGDEWQAVEWVKTGILLAFRIGQVREFPAAPAPFFDKDTLPLRETRGVEENIRLVPGGTSVRSGAFLAKDVIIMPPAFVNVGAYVAQGTMIDSHALVGSCAQVGQRVHLSAGAQLGGVLEPVGLRPVIVEDDVLIGGNVGVFEGTLVGKRAVLAPGVQLTASTTVYDLVREETYRAAPGKPLTIPDGSVVVPGAREASGPFAGQHGIHLYAPIIVKYRDASTDAATALEEALR